MPERASSPLQACSTDSWTKWSQSWPAWTTTEAPPQESRAVAMKPWLAIFRTVPSKPSSETTRLEPPPTINKGSPARSAALTAAMMSASVAAST
jgi:hypothetical protein